MFGATILSYLSDRLGLIQQKAYKKLNFSGRRKSFLLSITISTVVNCATALSPNYLIFLALRFIAGFGLGVRIISFNTWECINSYKFRVISTSAT